jgi:hypothetical protein
MPAGRLHPLRQRAKREVKFIAGSQETKEDSSLIEKFPEWVHGYPLSGRAVTWHSRPRKPLAS